MIWPDQMTDNCTSLSCEWSDWMTDNYTSHTILWLMRPNDWQLYITYYLVNGLAEWLDISTLRCPLPRTIQSIREWGLGTNHQLTCVTTDLGTLPSLSAVIIPITTATAVAIILTFQPMWPFNQSISQSASSHIFSQQQKQSEMFDCRTTYPARKVAKIKTILKITMTYQIL